MKRDVKTRNLIFETCAGIAFPVCMVLGLFMIFHGNLTGSEGFQGGILIALATVIRIVYKGREVSETSDLHRLHFEKSMNLREILLIVGLAVIYGLVFINSYLEHAGKNALGFSTTGAFWTDFSLGFKVVAGVGLLTIIFRSALNSGDEE